MSTPLILPSPRVEAFGYHSRILFHWTADRMRLTALGGEVPVFTRPSAATVNDSMGVSRSVGHSQSRWSGYDANLDGIADFPALLLDQTLDESLVYPFLAPPQVMSIYLRFVELGIASGARLTLGSAALGTPYLLVRSSGTAYQAVYHNGSTTVTANLSTAPATGNRVELRIVLNAQGSVTIAQALNDGDEGTPSTSGTPSSGPAIAAAWSDTMLWINGESSATAGTALYRAVKVAAGIRSMSDLRTRAY